VWLQLEGYLDTLSREGTADHYTPRIGEKGKELKDDEHEDGWEETFSETNLTNSGKPAGELKKQFSKEMAACICPLIDGFYLVCSNDIGSIFNCSTPDQSSKQKPPAGVERFAHFIGTVCLSGFTLLY